MPVPQNSPRLDRTSLRDDVYRRLREDIVAGVYLPGERLRESMIEARMGASRTPVREALSRLDADGFVDVLPQRETRVRDVGSQEICDAIIVLRHVFGTQVQLAVESHDAAMLACIRAYHSLIVEDLLAEARAFAEGDALGELLDAFLCAAGNPTLQRAVRAIALHLRWYANTTPGLATHLGVGAARVADILGACERDDAERVRLLFDDWFAQVRLARARLDEALAVGDAIEGIAAIIDALMVVVDASENQSLVTILLSLTPWIYRRTQLLPAPDLRLLDEVLTALEDGIDRRDAGAADRAAVAFFDQVAVRVGRATPMIMVDDAGVRTDEQD